MLLLFEISSLVKAASSLIFLKRIPYTKLALKLLEEKLFQMGCKGRIKRIYKGRKIYKLNNKQWKVNCRFLQQGWRSIRYALERILTSNRWEKRKRNRWEKRKRVCESIVKMCVHHWGTIHNSCPLLNDNKVAYTVLGACPPPLSFNQSQKLIHRMVSLHKGVLNR